MLIRVEHTKITLKDFKTSITSTNEKLSHSLDQPLNSNQNDDVGPSTQTAPELVTDTLNSEEERSALVKEMKKRSVNKTYINSNMDLTFSLRRKEIVEAEPLVSEVRERWPALFTEEQASKQIAFLLYVIYISLGKITSAFLNTFTTFRWII